jgi:hypothetical protein
LFQQQRAMLGLRDGREDAAGTAAEVSMVQGSPDRPACRTCGRQLTCAVCDAEVTTPVPRATARAAGAGYGLQQGQQSYTSSSAAARPPWIEHVQAQNVHVTMASGRQRAAANEGGAAASTDQSRPTVRQLDYLVVLLNQRGLQPAEQTVVLTSVRTKAAASRAISRLLAGLLP